MSDNKIKNFDINPTNGGIPALENSNKLIAIDWVLLIKKRLVQDHIFFKPVYDCCKRVLIIEVNSPINVTT